MPVRSVVHVVATTLAIALSLLAIRAPSADAQESNPDAAQQLADRFAPIMMIKAQSQPCDEDGEPYGPTAVDIVLDNPEVLLRQVGAGDPVVLSGPTASDVFELGEGFFLDFPGGAYEPGCIYERDSVPE